MNDELQMKWDIVTQFTKIFACRMWKSEIHLSWFIRSEETKSLSELLESGSGKDYVHFVLLRHFAWLPWRDHVAGIGKFNTIYKLSLFE